ncbi:S-adenosyl-L-methionine-dependent methyltransferase [Xylaria sp. FL0933]|nr:S-adenosyl-L-methionine-dependent methyltransferase [Xylaria sp. FL0933]
MVADFEKQSYWHNRFAKETSFEWLAPSATLISFMEPYLSPPSADITQQQRILHLGSGTSDLAVRLRERGHKDITNVDYEPLALVRGREMEEVAFGDVVMEYAVADVTRMRLVDLPTTTSHQGSHQGSHCPQGFDIIVDKSTIDAVACGGDEAVLAMARSVRECLKTDGVWISLSYSAQRFEIEGLGFDVCVIGNIATPKARATDPDVFYWCYLLRPR